jgi:hypothetical protein
MPKNPFALKTCLLALALAAGVPSQGVQDPNVANPGQADQEQAAAEELRRQIFETLAQILVFREEMGYPPLSDQQLTEVLNGLLAQEPEAQGQGAQEQRAQER